MIFAEFRNHHPRVMPLLGRSLLIAMAVLLLYLTVRSTGADIFRDLGRAHFLLLGGALVLYGFIQVLGAWRWKLLLEVQGIRLVFSAVFKLTLIGGFFSLLIPGAASGDIIKIAYAGKNEPGRIPAITLTIVLDRILGLSGLFLVAFAVTLVSLPTLLPIFLENPALRWALLAVNLGFAGSVGLYLFYRLRDWAQRRYPEKCSGDWLEKILPRAVNSLIRRFFAGLDLYRNCQGVLFRHLGISALIHFCCGCCFFMLGKALHETVMSFQQYQITMQISNATGILPVTPGGLGLRDFTAAAFFRIFDVTPAEVSGSIALSYSLVMLFWAVAGALLLSFSPNLRHLAKS